MVGFPDNLYLHFYVLHVCSNMNINIDINMNIDMNTNMNTIKMIDININVDINKYKDIYMEI